MVSKTIDDFPEPETPVKMVSFRFGMRTETFWRLFSRAPRISMNSSMCFSCRSPCFVVCQSNEIALYVKPAALGENRLVTEDFAEGDEAEEDAPQHSHGPKVRLFMVP